MLLLLLMLLLTRLLHNTMDANQAAHFAADMTRAAIGIVRGVNQMGRDPVGGQMQVARAQQRALQAQQQAQLEMQQQNMQNMQAMQAMQMQAMQANYMAQMGGMGGMGGGFGCGW